MHTRRLSDPKAGSSWNAAKQGSTCSNEHSLYIFFYDWELLKETQRFCNTLFGPKNRLTFSNGFLVFVVSSHSAMSLNFQFRLAVASFGNPRSNCEVHRKLSVWVVSSGHQQSVLQNDQKLSFRQLGAEGVNEVNGVNSGMTGYDLPGSTIRSIDSWKIGWVMVH